MKKKKIIFILVCVVILSTLYLGYKGYIFKKYYHNIKITTTQGETINIKTNRNVTSDAKFGKMKYVKFNDNFIKDEKTDLYYLERKENTESNEITFKAVYKVGYVKSTYNSLISVDGIGEIMKGSEIKRVFQKLNIKNDIELTKYFLKHGNDKLNIFSSINKLKMNHIMAITNPFVDKVSFINGDIKGYIQTSGGNNVNRIKLYYIVNIVYKNDVYYFWFFNGYEKYFNNDNIKEFLSNISFD